MAAFFGVTNTGGLDPATGHVSEYQMEGSAEPVMLKDESGNVVRMTTQKMIRTTHRIQGKGTIALADAAVGEIAADTVEILSVSATENQADYPDFEIQGVTYSDLGA